ncbi:4Fe-4S dicluster domain-containing protein [Inmirania thermothiophila]|nr:4Fe-4S binding protein [Inmirania thermothiophila]
MDDLAQAVQALDGSALVVDDEFCLNLRGRSEWCSACADVCPHEALALSLDEVALDGERCTGCGACVPACPAGALRLTGFSPARLLETVAGQETVRLHCRESRSRAGGVVIPCHAVLDARLVAAMAADGVAEVVLHGLEGCEGCARGDARAAVEQVHERLSAWFGPQAPKLRAADGAEEGAAQAGDVRARADQVRMSRRAFLRFAGARAADGALAAVPATWALAAEDEDERLDLDEPSPFFQGEVERQREAAYQAVLAPRLAGLPWVADLEAPPWRGRRIEAHCTACLSCGTRCPTGALRAEESDGERRIVYDAARCTDCALCERICPAKAIHPEPAPPAVVREGTVVLMARALVPCAHCETPYLPESEDGLCPTCRNERELDDEWMSWLGG